jgi:hypothetical protein
MQPKFVSYNAKFGRTTQIEAVLIISQDPKFGRMVCEAHILVTACKQPLKFKFLLGYFCHKGN